MEVGVRGPVQPRDGNDGLRRVRRVPGYPLTPLLFIAASGAIVANTFFTQPGRALLGLSVVLLGTPAFFLWRRAAARAAIPVPGETTGLSR